jgi:hypothetical protein
MAVELLHPGSNKRTSVIRLACAMGSAVVGLAPKRLRNVRAVELMSEKD